MTDYADLLRTLDASLRFRTPYLTYPRRDVESYVAAIRTLIQERDGLQDTIRAQAEEISAHIDRQWKWAVKDKTQRVRIAELEADNERLRETNNLYGQDKHSLEHRLETLTSALSKNSLYHPVTCDCWKCQALRADKERT